MEETLVRIARQVDSKKFGKYRGFVDNNEDPDQRGRLKLKIPSVLGTEVSDWALPCLPFGGASDYGFFAVPEQDAQVWVEFEEGDRDKPIWTGTFWQTKADTPSEAALTPPTVRLIKTPSGHRIQFDDTEDDEQLLIHHRKGAEILLDKNGTITVTNPDGAELLLDAENGKVNLADANGNTLLMSSSGTTIEDANGSKVDMTASGITVKASQIVLDGQTVMLGGTGGEPVIKGTSFLSLFATHVHPTGVGPSGPPIPQGEATSLSQKVLTA
jgi:hypothetical protein